MSWLHVVLDLPDEVYDDAAAFWERALGWPAGPSWPGHPELRSLEPPRGSPYVHVQRIDGPPRVHLDVESEDPGRTVGRAVALGAVLVAESDRWWTLRSPGGLPFCLLHAVGHDAPGPVTWLHGHRSRLVQVCVDSPADEHEDEVAFWRGLLPGRWAASGSPEFAGKWHDDAGSPLQLLFQRLDQPSGPVRAHLDLGTDDLAAEVERLTGLGAVDVRRGRGWQTLSDPAGLDFCATENSPATTRVREIG